MDETLNEKQVVVGLVVYLLLSYIDKNDTTAKTQRKRILRDVSRELAKYRNKHRLMYLKLAYESNDILQRIYDKMVLEQVDKEKLSAITPSGLLDYLDKKDPSLLEPFMFPVNQRKILTMKYNKSNLGFQSLMYVNRLLEEIDAALENARNMSDEELKQKTVEIMEETGNAPANNVKDYYDKAFDKMHKENKDV